MTITDIVKRQLIEGLSAPAVYRINVQIHCTIKNIMRSDDNFFILENSRSIRKNVIRISGNQFAKKCDRWTPLPQLIPFKQNARHFSG